jgi:hypothetical protein
MYRCSMCDTPAEQGHQSDCPLMQEVVDDPWWPDDGAKINVASGEDVVLA